MSTSDEVLVVVDLDKTREKVKQSIEEGPTKDETYRMYGVVGFYLFVSIGLVLVTKNVFLNNFAYPLFLTWFQLLISFVMLWGLNQIGQTMPLFESVPTIEFDLSVAKRVFTLSVIFLGMQVFTNLCLLYVEIPFFQIARSMTVCFTVVLTYIIFGQSAPPKAVKAIGVVFGGIFIGSIGEANFLWSGLVYGITSSMFVSLYGIFAKQLLAELGQWKLLLYNTIISIYLMIPLLWISGELNQLRDADCLHDPQLWIGLVISGVFSFLVNIAVFLQIKYMSPLINNITAALKACLQLFIAIFIYSNTVSLLSILGIGMSIFGSFWYSHVRYGEVKDKILGSK